MNINQLKIFVRLASMNSFTKTAESFFLSQPTISLRIKSLEEELNTTLFKRTSSGKVLLTEDGELLLKHAKAILKDYKELSNMFIKDHADPNQQIKVACCPVPGVYLLPELISCYLRDKNEVSINIITDDTHKIISEILDYSYDFGIVDFSATDERLDYIKILEEDILIVTYPGKFNQYGFYNGDHIPLKFLVDFLNEQKIIYREANSITKNIFENTLAEKGYQTDRVNSFFIIDNIEGVKQLIRNDLGIGLLSKYSVQDYLTIKKLDGFYLQNIKMKKSYYIVHHNNKFISSKAKEIMDYIITHYSFFDDIALKA